MGRDRTSRRWLIGGALTACACLVTAVPCAAAGGKATRAIPVSVNVTQSCNVSATPMAFSGLLGFLTRDATATIVVRCSPNIAFTVDLDNGQHPNGTVRRVRNLTSATYLNYEIYKDAARSNRWGAGSPRNVAGNSGGSGLASLTVYGRLQAGTGLILGQYSDSLTVTLSF